LANSSGMQCQHDQPGPWLWVSNIGETKIVATVGSRRPGNDMPVLNPSGMSPSLASWLLWVSMHPGQSQESHDGSKNGHAVQGHIRHWPASGHGISQNDHQNVAMVATVANKTICRNPCQAETDMPERWVAEMGLRIMIWHGGVAIGRVSKEGCLRVAASLLEPFCHGR
jgi:hypothetical protein